jgi:hypothetical protein
MMIVNQTGSDFFTILSFESDFSFSTAHVVADERDRVTLLKKVGKPGAFLVYGDDRQSPDGERDIELSHRLSQRSTFVKLEHVVLVQRRPVAE